MVNLKEEPFNLHPEDIDWVMRILAEMTLEEKIGQMICPRGVAKDEHALKELVSRFHIGAIMYRPAEKGEKQEIFRKLQSFSKIPLLLAANNECGGNGAVREGTSFGCAMAVAATDNPENAYHMGYTACAEGSAVGLNWIFGPVVDIDRNFHNPITNNRTFGSDSDRVLACASQYIRAAEECHMAASIKHFPGDGCDERDQHIATTINDLSTEKWEATYGKVYRELIRQGVKSVMVGHIAQPAYVEEINPKASNKEKLMPASLSRELITGLLRERLNFKGLVVTDATLMLGFQCAMKREDALPEAILAGCDMILFNKNLKEDFEILYQAVVQGRIAEERINESVARILGVKASLGLHQKQKTGELVPPPSELDTIGSEQFKIWARKNADESITLVKDSQKLFPVTPDKYRRVLLNILRKTPVKNDPLGTYE